MADTLDSQLTGFREKTSSAQTEATKLDPSQAEKLWALGYLASDSAVAKSSDKAVVDPKDKIEIANKFHRALVDLEEDDYEGAVANLREVVRLEPTWLARISNLGVRWSMAGSMRRRCRSSDRGGEESGVWHGAL